ncbi:hypothetical protein psal_cds_663 [Pandoravirus salinus]|uniref:Uncharacterized protein n=1 Tax=Pandoravirus salinus TaxID=1349410 RepID=S4W2A0_9VIRU|nr:hypothetical protein psal_cds_663 [Pandoravirus salinus]AGO84577.2 hypothetical protein psal_cds_663 [Pandoravirus salinus]
MCVHLLRHCVCSFVGRSIHSKPKTTAAPGKSVDKQKASGAADRVDGRRSWRLRWSDIQIVIKKKKDCTYWRMPSPIV